MKTQISNSMLMVLIINMIYAKAIGVTQGILARQSGADMWIVTIFSTLLGLFIMWLTVVIIKRLPEKDIIEQTRVLVGKWGAKFIALLLFIFFFTAFGGVMITVVYHLMDYFLPELPSFIFVIVTMIVGLYGIFKGIEVIGRLAILGVFSLIVLNILLLLGSLTYFEIEQFLPVLRNGFINAIETTKHPNGDWAMATLMVSLILPMVKQKEKWSKFSGKGILYGGGLILMWPILEVGVLSPEVSGQYIVACMQMARSAEIGLFVHRYELIMIIFFSLSALIQVMMCLLCASISAKHIINGKNLNRIFIPTSILLGLFGYWIVDDHTRAMTFLTYYWPPVAMTITFGVPIMVFLLGVLFKNKLKQNGKEEKVIS